jgi:flagellum-specific ATP synthase
MHNITKPDHQQLARNLKQLYSRYQRNRDLISVGAYSAGSDPVLDQAITLNPKDRSISAAKHRRTRRHSRELGATCRAIQWMNTRILYL